MNTNCSERGIINSDHIVNKIIVSIKLMYKGITSIEDITLSRVRMNSVAVPQIFPSQPDYVGTETSTTNETEVPQKSGLVIETNALTGIHTPKAFTKRIWMNFDTVKLTSYLFNFVVCDHVIAQMYQNTNVDAVVMQFFYK